MEFYYSKSKYVADDSLAIQTYVKDEEYGYLEPYGTVTVCLVDYGMTPEDGTIFIPAYKMTDDFFEQVLDDIVEEIITGIKIGYGKGYHVRLKPNWEELVNMV